MPEMNQAAPAPGQAPAQPQQQPSAQQGGGNAQQMVADIHTRMLELASKMQGNPNFQGESQQLGQLIQGFESLVNGLSAPGGQAPPQAPPGAEAMGTTTPEAGAAAVRPTM